MTLIALPLLESHPALAVWVDLSLRLLALALAIGVLTAALHRQPAALRHRLWTACLLGMLLLPVLHAILPALPLPLLPAGPPVPDALSATMRLGFQQSASPIPSATRTHSLLALLPAALLGLYLLGAGILFVRLLAAWSLTRRLVARSHPIPDRALSSLAGHPSLLSPHASHSTPRARLPVRLLVSPDVRVPLTTGCRRPVVLLPPAWTTWSTDTLRAVIAHEAEHIRRHDPLLTLLSAANRCLYWFHPAAWWVNRRLADLSEEACDAAAVQLVGSPQGYATALLDVARALQTGPRVAWLGVAMARSPHVSRRIHRILENPVLENPMTYPHPTRRLVHWTLGVLSLVLLLAMATIQATRPVQAQSVTTSLTPEPPQSPVPTPATHPPPPPEPPPATEAPPAPEPAPRPAPTPQPVQAAPTPSPLQPGDVSPSLLEKVDPTYPPLAKQARIEGMVAIRLVVGADGLVKDPTVLSGHPLLQQAALDAIRQWRFQPARRNGVAIDVSAATEINFRLLDGPNTASAPHRKWLNEDVTYLITPAERAAFEKLTTSDERDHFITQFWSRLDPTPGTPQNERKDEHYARIAHANSRFSGDLPGWRTDRGRVYITHGQPDDIQALADGEEAWLYRYVEGLGANVRLEFDASKRIKLKP